MKRLIINFSLLSASVCSSAMNLTLQECRDMALATDERIKIAQNGVLGAVLDCGMARTQYLPKLSGSANAFYMAPDTEMGESMKMQIRGAYMAGISLTQPIYAGGKIVAGNRMAAVGKKISEEQLRASRMDVIAESEKSYWTYVAVLSKVEMTQSYLNMLDSVYALTNDAVEVGLQSANTLLRVNTRRSELVYRLNQARAGADVCRLALCRLIGLADSVSIVPVETVNGIPRLPGMMTDIENRPETRILTHMVDLRKHEVSLTRGDFLPTVGVLLGWNAYGNMKMKGWAQDMEGNPMPYTSTISNNGFMGIIAVEVPLFHWGEGIKKVRKAKLEVENARLTLERNRRLMELESRQAYSNLEVGVELIKSAEIAMSEAEDNLRMMKEQYEVGLITLTDLLEAQSQWHTSYSNLIEARTQLRINQVDYLRAIGELD